MFFIYLSTDRIYFYVLNISKWWLEQKYLINFVK